MSPTYIHTHTHTPHTLLPRLPTPSGQKEAAFKEFDFVGSTHKILTQMLLGNQAPDFSGPTWQQALSPWLILGPGLHHQLSPSIQRFWPEPPDCVGSLPTGTQNFPAGLSLGVILSALCHLLRRASQCCSAHSQYPQPSEVRGRCHSVSLERCQEQALNFLRIPDQP